jgi:hypothetical protein
MVKTLLEGVFAFSVLGVTQLAEGQAKIERLLRERAKDPTGREGLGVFTDLVMSVSQLTY